MRVLLDRCMGRSSSRQLAAAGHDVNWAGDWPEDPGDPAILQMAYEQRRVLITIDKDFGGLAVRDGMSHVGIIRLDDIAARDQAAACLPALTEYADALEAGAIITIRPGRIRVRLPQQMDDLDGRDGGQQ